MINEIIFLGPPGVGKGTIASKIQEMKGTKHISTGDIFRAEVKNKTELGLQVQKIMSDGEYVPDSITNEIVKNVLNSKEIKENGFLLDGYPRTINQAEFLDSEGLTPKKAILLEAEPALIIKRLSGRRACPTCKKNYHIESLKPKIEGICDLDNTKLIQRADDQPEAIKNRLSVYENQTKILIDFYERKGILVRIDANPSADEIIKSVEKELF